MKKVLLVNGSPRKQWNTAMLLEKAMEGAASAGAETTMVHLYDLDFKGCVSCFACKRAVGAADICVIQDALRPVLEQAMQSDAIIIGTPIYYSDMTASVRAFLERLMFMNLTYNKDKPSKFDGAIATGVIYTMNVPDELLSTFGYDKLFLHTRDLLVRHLNGRSEYLAATDTMQYADYSKYMGNMFDPAHKARMRAEKFPADLQAAYAMGMRLAE